MVAAKLRTFLCTPNKTLLALPSVAGTLTRGLTHFVRILAHVLAPQSLALYRLLNLKEISWKEVATAKVFNLVHRMKSEPLLIVTAISAAK